MKVRRWESIIDSPRPRQLVDLDEVVKDALERNPTAMFLRVRVLAALGAYRVFESYEIALEAGLARLDAVGMNGSQWVHPMDDGASYGFLMRGALSTVNEMRRRERTRKLVVVTFME